MADRPVVRIYPPPPGLKAWPHVGEWEWPHWEHWLRTALFTPEEIEQYRIDRESHGVAVRNADGTVRWLYQPTPKQVEAHKCPQLNMLFGGAVGGAKSYWARWDAYKRSLIVPEYQTLILRRSFPELERTHMRDAAREVGAFGAKFVEGEVRFPNRSIIEFGHMQDEKAVGKYLSAQYDAIYPDEGATFPGPLLLEVMSRARSTKKGVKAITRIPTNPGGANTLWLVDRFIDKTITAEEDPYYDPAQHAYIPSKLYDNPWLMDADGTFRTYEARLGPIGPERRRQLLEGDWSAISGQFFPEFSRNTHVRDVPIPEYAEFELWLDWGYNAPGICHWVALMPDKHLYVRHEWKFSQTIAQDVAKNIRRMTDELARDLGRKIRIRKAVGDPSMWNHTGHTGESIAETFARNGVSMVKGDNEREIGWQRFRHWLSRSPDGVPWLYYHPSCAYALRTIPSLVGDKHKPEDVDTEGDDHAGDADRYGVMSRPAPSRPYEPPNVNPLSLGWLKRRAKKTVYAA
jgi:hypothetical protein